MNTAQLGHRQEGPGGYSALCSQLPAFCSWSVRLATKPRPGVPTCCLWDLGFLIRKSPEGMPLRACGHCGDMGASVRMDFTCRCQDPGQDPSPGGPPHRLQMGVSWGDTGQPTSGVLLPIDGTDMVSPCPDFQPGPHAWDPEWTELQASPSPCLPACWFWPLTFT